MHYMDTNPSHTLLEHIPYLTLHGHQSLPHTTWTPILTTHYLNTNPYHSLLGHQWTPILTAYYLNTNLYHVLHGHQSLPHTTWTPILYHALLGHQSLPRTNWTLILTTYEHTSKECCLQLQGRPMDDIQRPSSLVAGIARAKHLYAPWRGNRCPVEKVLNFPETSMSIQIKSVVCSSRGGPWMIFRGQIPWLQE
jgi:hypothetical protein